MTHRTAHLVAALLGASLACGGRSSSSHETEPCPVGFGRCTTDGPCVPIGMGCPGAEDASTADGSLPRPNSVTATVASGATGAGGASTPVLQPPTPNAIRCGGRTCDATKEYCCTSGGNGGAGGGGTFNTCSPTFCPQRRECDETADCLGTDVCCFSVVSSPPPVLASHCAPRGECGSDYAWIGCGSQEDCTALGAPECVAQTCRGSHVQTCGPVRRTSCF